MGIGLQAIQLSPCHTGLAEPQFQRLLSVLGFVGRLLSPRPFEFRLAADPFQWCAPPIGLVTGVAQCLSVCRWLRLADLHRRRPQRGAPLCTRWARTRRGRVQRFSLYAHATKSDTLRDSPSAHQGLHALSVVRMAGGWKSGTISCPSIAN